ncbi:unnamed protein product [Prorocentrum cordatum]|uniref:BACK domain-containing protein n=1 Tax=Prorocentrum cordatum TaxID=2364126 RepID=A0ABN9PRM2_9DINO|nr:unnamed protein product [Polarella glacialis]
MALDGATKLYREIYQETSSGDLGIQVRGGPVFRCHSQVLAKTGGLVGKIRQFGRQLPRQVPEDSVRLPLDYFREKNYTTLLEDLVSITLSQPIERSALRGAVGSFLNQREDPMKPGFTTSRFVSGTTGAIKRANPFCLAERYEVDCDCERMAEMLRFSYQGVMSFFDITPSSDKERISLTDKMLKILLDAEKFSVDALYEQLLRWFSKESFKIVGERNYCNAFYALQHFEQRCTEEHSREALVNMVTNEMLAQRGPFNAVTRDARWGSLPVQFVEKILDSDALPIDSETEVLNLIERWNANANKQKEEIAILLACFRPDEETRGSLIAWVRNMGWLDGNDVMSKAPPGPAFDSIRKILQGTGQRKEPRTNHGSGAWMEQGGPGSTRAAFDESAFGRSAFGRTDDSSGGEQQQPNTFLQYKGGVAVSEGHSFRIGAQQRLVQVDALRRAGIQRMRVAFSNPGAALWDVDHEVFVGLSYGEGRYFGYIVSGTAFAGIFGMRALASAAPAPQKAVHLTGGGNKVEFDLALEVQLHRANLVVACKLQVIFGNEVLTEEFFQISYETLRTGPGLRYQVVATGLGDAELDVQLAWVGGGIEGEEEDTTVAGMLDFAEGD